jgi:aspartyl-tRNA(Asn)/glutamyl-tRNA(Gln) amidotransferase subunit A
METAELSRATIGQLQEKLARKELSKQELLDFFIRRIEIFEPKIDSTLEIFEKDSILRDSELASAQNNTQNSTQDKNAQNSALAGIPGFIKDNICMEGRKASCASRMLENFVAPYSATAVARLQADGALLLGRTNMDEFAMGSSTETSAFKKTRNPWDLSRVPGGSSGGSAAAVAAGLAPWALGSETGGSVRQPAAFCGIVGLKPTYGLVSRYGLIAYASSLDQIGIFSRSVHDNALVLSSIAGHDKRDFSSLAVEKKQYAQGLDGLLPAGLKIGVVDLSVSAQGVDTEIAAGVESAVQVLAGMGAQVKTISLPALNYSTAAYFILSRAEAASNLARFDGVRYGMRDKKAGSLTSMYRNTRHDGFGSEVRTRIVVGNYVLASGHAGEYYENAKKVQRLIRREMLDAFKDVDIMIMPTHSTPAFQFGAYEDNKLQIDLQDYFTCPINLTGVPAISIPCGFTRNNLPIGFQLIGPHLSEELLFKVAHAYEQKTPWHTMHPAGF